MRSVRPALVSLLLFFAPALPASAQAPFAFVGDGARSETMADGRVLAYDAHAVETFGSGLRRTWATFSDDSETIVSLCEVDCATRRLRFHGGLIIRRGVVSDQFRGLTRWESPSGNSPTGRLVAVLCN